MASANLTGERIGAEDYFRVADQPGVIAKYYAVMQDLFCGRRGFLKLPAKPLHNLQGSLGFEPSSLQPSR